MSASAGLSRAPDPAEIEAFVAEFLGRAFLAPPDDAAVDSMTAPEATRLLREIAASLSEQDAAETMCAALTRGPPGAVAADLARRHVGLFSGVSGPRTIPIYESAYTGGARHAAESFADLQAILRRLDLRVADDCAEPVDHLSLELALYATALRCGDGAATAAMLDRLAGWVPAFCAKVAAADPGGVYGAAARLLAALVRHRIPAHSSPLQAEGARAT
ncbi:TorD/DmsD family molecular chaperone [Rhodovulum euryhalinum]|uniref:TorA-specific chaperone n=1 Tax=Rhodovulum euryhalinum TaxID=35805 RepID=A0A4V2S9L4_9RHOB|nr:molecular chaperone TorD family protein [Rhodovulum euryhalinum]TCO68260.1 TorA-specific chaperone [Rhodovulum euryhalinum]